MTTTTPTSSDFYTKAEQQQNWENLHPEQRDYFNRLASGDPDRTGKEFFEDTVHPELQDRPNALQVYLDGGTVEYTDPETGELVTLEIQDRDWSHDTSVANGGSDSADNGRFEDSSTNRARGAEDSNSLEQTLADADTERDVEILLEADIPENIDSAIDVEEAATAAIVADTTATAFDFVIDGILPLVGSTAAAYMVYEHFDKPKDKIGYAALAGGGTALLLASPVAAPLLGAYAGWRLADRGYKLYKKYAVKA